MKLSCSVIQDLLPLYYDGVCSEESAKLVQDHLAQCNDCSAMLDALKGEIVESHASADEVKPLEDIKRSIRKGKRQSLGKGMLAAVALILVVVLIGSGAWYNRIGKHYDVIADKMEPMTAQMSAMTAATHYLGVGDYGVILQKPMIFSDSGFIRVGTIDKTINFLNGIYNEEAWNKEVSLELFFYPEQSGYKFALSFDVRDQDILNWVWVNPDLSPDMEEEFYDLQEQQEYAELLEEYRIEIEVLFNVVEEQFGISYLQ